MKTRTKSLSSLIKDGRFDWYNSNIESNFKAEDVRGEFKVFHFDRSISSEDAIKEIEKDGYAPANLTELLTFASKEWNGTDWVIALGSVAEILGRRGVPSLGGRGRERGLRWWGGDWDDLCRFLAVRNGSQALAPQSSALGNLDTLPLEPEINGVKYKKV